MRRVFKKPMLATTMAIMAATMALGSQAASAQGGQPGPQAAGLQTLNACSTTSYADVVSNALGMTAAELRKDMVSGQTLQQIAQSKNVDIQTVTAAIQAASKAEIDQAAKDGVLTQDEATALESRAAGPQGNGGPQQGNGAPQQGNGGRQGNQQGAAPAQLPDISNLSFLLQSGSQNTPGQRPGGFGGRGFGGGISFNVVKPYTVAAQALNLKCSDLVKTISTTSGKTIAAVAADQKVDAKTVTDALTNAYKSALAQDVTDTIITQAQADQVSANLDAAVTNFVNNANMGRRGPRPTPTQSGQSS